MNRTEITTFRWLLSQGYAARDITFQRRRSPDFLTADGRCWETKLSRNHTATFTRNQVEGLKGQGCSVVVFEAEHPDATEPSLVVPYDDAPCPSRVGKYRFALAGGSMSHMARLDDETYRALEGLAAKNRRSVTAELAIILETHIEVMEGWPT